MKKTELKKTLLSYITEAEWDQLENRPYELVIGAFNRETILRMQKNGMDDTEEISEQWINGLYHVLKEYLQKYMPEQPEGHKWIIIACIYLAGIEQVPMHPQEYVGWVKNENGYACPNHSGSHSVCRYCACKKLTEK